ncbi:hypothetical protein EG329_013974 [Mollisiaceae sp. DMI_Dod_QoI]|nr:hypothetical protein EG329_013974 [Helotiales sp. DMI_Dod_QoI]
MVHISFVAFAVLLFATIIIAADKDNGVTFSYPPAGLTFNYLDIINVSYTSPFPQPVLLTICLRYNGGNQLEKDNQYVHPNNSSNLVLISWTEFVSCYFTLQPSKAVGNESLGTNSPWFRINSEARSTPTIFGLNQDSTTTTANPSISTPAPSQGLGSGAKIGIGVGVALGVSLILAASGVVFLLRRNKKAKTRASAQLLDADAESPKSEFGTGLGEHFMPMKSIPIEMQAKTPISQTPHELPSETAFKMRDERRVRELSSEEEVRQSPRRTRFSWESIPAS